jgi:hypothetical protein
LPEPQLPEAAIPAQQIDIANLIHSLSRRLSQMNVDKRICVRLRQSAAEFMQLD